MNEFPGIIHSAGLHENTGQFVGISSPRIFTDSTASANSDPPGNQISVHRIRPGHPHKLEERRGCIGCHQASPVDLIPGTIVIDPDVLQEVFLSPFPLYRDGEGKHTIGSQDPAPVSIGLLLITVELFKEIFSSLTSRAK